MTTGLFSKSFSGNEADDFKDFTMNKGCIQTSVIHVHDMTFSFTLVGFVE